MFWAPTTILPACTSAPSGAWSVPARSTAARASAGLSTLRTSGSSNGGGPCRTRGGRRRTSPGLGSVSAIPDGRREETEDPTRVVYRPGALQFPRGQRPAARSRRARRVERGHVAGDRTSADRGVAADVASRPVAGGQCPLAAGSGAGPRGRPTSPSSCVGTRVLSPARRDQARSRAYGPAVPGRDGSVRAVSIDFEPLQVALSVARALERCGLRYVVGGFPRRGRRGGRACPTDRG